MEKPCKIKACHKSNSLGVMISNCIEATEEFILCAHVYVCNLPKQMTFKMLFPIFQVHTKWFETCLKLWVEKFKAI